MKGKQAALAANRRTEAAVITTEDLKQHLKELQAKMRKTETEARRVPNLQKEILLLDAQIKANTSDEVERLSIMVTDLRVQRDDVLRDLKKIRTAWMKVLKWLQENKVADVEKLLSIMADDAAFVFSYGVDGKVATDPLAVERIQRARGLRVE